MIKYVGIICILSFLMISLYTSHYVFSDQRHTATPISTRIAVNQTASNSGTLTWQETSQSSDITFSCLKNLCHINNTDITDPINITATTIDSTSLTPHLLILPNEYLLLEDERRYYIAQGSGSPTTTISKYPTPNTTTQFTHYDPEAGRLHFTTISPGLKQSFSIDWQNRIQKEPFTPPAVD